MSRTKKQANPYYKELVRKSEIKRIGEHLTKSELTSILGVHYNFYWNCVTDRNEPSESLAKSLEVYLKTPTEKVYETIFARRPQEEKDKKKRIRRDENGKEIYHESLNIDEDYEEKVIEEFTNNKVFKAPQEANMKP